MGRIFGSSAAVGSGEKQSQCLSLRDRLFHGRLVEVVDKCNHCCLSGKSSVLTLSVVLYSGCTYRWTTYATFGAHLWIKETLRTENLTKTFRTILFVWRALSAKVLSLPRHW
ncbi:MAG: hypothetical protein SRB2_02714 [Desulfobacteraceae bacterium Eth-SRB2]|nr:MAG: hypothetical protein SRB2_02714 [Desulfobacteraceae bacterium Eth-SRB2]